MTLRELIQSVDSEQYSDSPLYQELCGTKPEFGSNRHILVMEKPSVFDPRGQAMLTLTGKI